MRFTNFGHWVWLALIALTVSTLSSCGDDDDADVTIWQCSGTCSCNEETRTCSCSGGTDCVLQGEGNVTFTCDGNAACGLSCGEDCNVICPGTTGCSAEAGARATMLCQGTAACEFTCHEDCSVSCSGAARCLVTCSDPDRCDLSDCRGATECGDGVFACGRDCP